MLKINKAKKFHLSLIIYIYIHKEVFVDKENKLCRLLLNKRNEGFTQLLQLI